MLTCRSVLHKSKECSRTGWSRGNALDLCSRGAWFEYRLGHGLSRLEVFRGFPYSLQKKSKDIISIGPVALRSKLFQFHPSHPTIQCCIFSIRKASLNKLHKSKERSLVTVPVGPLDLHVHTLQKRSRYRIIHKSLRKSRQ
jgi:hypothetical protein